MSDAVCGCDRCLRRGCCANLSDRLGGQLGKRAAPHVDCARHGLKMVGVDARSDPAKVIKLKSGVDRSDEHRINGTMGARGGTAYGRDAIAGKILGVLPDPARSQIPGRAFGPAEALAAIMAVDVSDRLTFGPAASVVGIGRDPRGPAAATFA